MKVIIDENMKATIVLLIRLCVFTSAQDGCKAPVVINAENGVISSPYYDYYPEFKYPPNLRCRYSINVPSNKNISIIFTPPFQTEGTYPDSCAYDYVMLYTGNVSGPVTCPRTLASGNKSVIAGPLCGLIEEELSVIIGESSVTLEFCTDISNEYQGFRFMFNATDEPATNIIGAPSTTTVAPVVTCGGSIDSLYFLSNSKLYIESPNYPNNYPDSASCIWYISGLEGKGLNVTAEDFHLEDSGMCRYDYLSVRDISEQVELGRFCGDGGLKNLRSNGDRLQLSFASDASGSYRGFRIRIEISRCNSSHTVCPNDPNGDECAFHPSMLCDGKADCPGGADENCPTGCGTATSKPIFSAKEKIVGGIEARPHSWPWQVGVVVDEEEIFMCGGSIIDHYYVLTAGRCCDGQSITSLRVRVGEHSFLGSREPNAQTYQVKNMFVHPRYHSQSMSTSYDFCLLETKLPIFFNDDVMPICLPPQSEPPQGKTCYITGWGDTEQIIIDKKSIKRASEKGHHTTTKEFSPVLRQLNVRIASREKCENDYGGLITPDMICTENSGKDGCQGDWGGPLQCSSWNDPYRFELVGVVSWAYGCADPKYSGVSGKVSVAVDWIASIIMNRAN